MPSFVQTLKAMPARSKAVLAVSAVAIFAIAFLLLRIAVEKAQVAQARVALAGQGVSLDAGSGGKGFELFDEQKLGASDFQQQVTYQRALEGEIARTIGGVAGVSGPQVQLVLPEDDLFADEASPATAAVMLANSADTMEPGAIRGVAQLVASSVEGLKT